MFLVMTAGELIEVCTHPLVDRPKNMLQLTFLSRISQCIALQTTQSLPDCYVSTRPHWNSITPHPALISPNAVSSRPRSLIFPSRHFLFLFLQTSSLSLSVASANPLLCLGQQPASGSDLQAVRQFFKIQLQVLS